MSDMVEQKTVDDIRLRGLDSRNLNLIAMPTEKCNFRCKYCYEDFAIGRMKPDIVSGIVRLINSRADSLENLSIAWFGGEPTLASDIIETVNRTCLGLPNLCFSSSISTNGYMLKRPLFSKLVDCGITVFQISLDGDQSDHDKTRIMKSGKGTFEVIYENIFTALDDDRDFKITIRLHLHGENLTSAQNLIKRIANDFTGERRVSVYLKNIEKLSGTGDVVDFLKGREHARLLRQELEEVGLYEHAAEPLACYAAMANSLVIRADGRIGKCTVALSDERNTVGSINPDGTLNIDNERFRPWIRGLLSGSVPELACPLHGLQFGGS